MSTSPFVNQPVLITGAARGLGLASARFFARLGAHVPAWADEAGLPVNMAGCHSAAGSVGC